MTLLKSTLFNLPIYFMSLSVILHKVSLRLEKIQRYFLWGGGKLQRRPHLVSWSIVDLDKKEGGLGARKLFFVNKVLLGKWCWRFANEETGCCREVWGGRGGLVF